MESANDDKNLANDDDKLLFAEDIVRHIMFHSFCTPYNSTRISPLREYIHNAFNGTMRTAVSHLCNRIQNINIDLLHRIDQLGLADRDKFYEFVDSLQAYYLRGEFDAKNFLFYCIELTILALKFRKNGLRDAPDLAVSVIFETLKNYNMLSGGWDSLTAVAAKYVNLFGNIADREP